jgi:hypothetical protein
MQSHKLPCLLGPRFGRCAAAVGIAGCLMGLNAFAAPASIGLPGDRVFSENITSTKDGTLYVGSLGSGGIIRIKPGAHTLCNDIAIGADGSAFVTNSAASQILKLPPGGNQLEVCYLHARRAFPSGCCRWQGQ